MAWAGVKAAERYDSVVYLSTSRVSRGRTGDINFATNQELVFGNTPIHHCTLGTQLPHSKILNNEEARATLQHPAQKIEICIFSNYVTTDPDNINTKAFHLQLLAGLHT